MQNTPTPEFLVIQAAPEAGAGTLGALSDTARLVGQAGGALLAAAAWPDVHALEPGSIAYTTVLAKWPDRAALDRFWTDLGNDARAASLLGDAQVRVLAATGLPEAGLPGDPLPTAASVDLARFDGTPAYMIIDGRAYDADRLAAYREIIFELMLERSSYYLVITDAAGVRILQGAWDEQIFAISKWPSLAHGRDFWFCERYQTEAIPTRTGAGRFTVNLFEGAETGT